MSFFETRISTSNIVCHTLSTDRYTHMPLHTQAYKHTYNHTHSQRLNFTKTVRVTENKMPAACIWEDLCTKKKRTSKAEKAQTLHFQRIIEMESHIVLLQQ